MIDANDVRIMKMLSSNGRMPNAEIARKLDMSEATVRQRIKKLIDSGALKITAQIDTSVFPDVFIVVVGIILNVLPEDLLEQITTLPNVLFSFTVTGRYDIVAVFVVNSRQMLSEIIESQIHSIQGVNRTETFVVLKNVGMDIDAGKYSDFISNLK